MLNVSFDEDDTAYRVASRFDQATLTVEGLIRKFSLVLLALLVCVVFLNVIMRYVFSESLLWANELSRYLMVWFALLMTSALVNQDDHLNVDMLYDRFSNRTKYLIQVSMTVLYAVLGLVWVNFGLQYALEAGLRATAPALGFQMIWVYSVIPISGALVSLFSVGRLVRLVLLKDTSSLETNYGTAGEDQQATETDEEVVDHA